MSIISKRQVSHAGIYMFGDILRRSVSIIMLPIYTRYLTPADYGIVELLSMLIDFATIIFGARVGQAIFRFYCTSDTEIDKKQIISSAIALAFTLNMLGAICLIAFASPLSMLIFSKDEYTNLIALFAITMMLMPLTEIPLAHIRAQQRPWLFFIFNIIKLALQLSLNIYFVVHMELHVYGVVYSAVISGIIISLLLVTYSISQVGFNVKLSTCKKLFNFSLPLKIATIGSFYLTFGDRYILTMFTDLSQIGLYALGYKFGFIFTILAWAPFEKMWDAEKYAIYKQNNALLRYQRIFIYISTLMIFIGLSIALFSKDILRIMSSPAFHDAYKVVPIIIVAYIFQAWTNFCNLGILISEKTLQIAHAEIIAAIIITIAYFSLIPLFGIYGAAWATVIGFIARFLWVNSKAKRIYNMKLPWTTVFIISALAIAIYNLSFTLPEDIVYSVTLRILLLIIFMLFYLALPILTLDEKKWLGNQLMNIKRRLIN